MITKVHIKGYRKFGEFKFEPRKGMNILVGANEAGKSTLLEAMTLALTGRVNGVRASDFLNPYLFNHHAIKNFFASKNTNLQVKNLPEFRIDVYLDSEYRNLEKFRGVNNMAKEDSVGLSIWAHPDPEYYDELTNYLNQEDCPHVIPIEYYIIEWLGFSGEPVFKRPKELAISLIDSRTIYSEKGIEYYTRQILENYLDPKERSNISVQYRKIRETFGRITVDNLNEKLAHEKQKIREANVGIQIDQSESSSWENSLIPDINSTPLSMAGQGNQARAKTILALGRTENTSNIVFIEEPENHLSHTRLRELISYIDAAAEGRQVFITTHSSYVLNRLGLDQVTILTNGRASKFDRLTSKTISYFKRLPGFDTMRLILADKILVVEGPSDEIIFNKFFKDRYDLEPMDRGIDVMSIRGTSFKRCFELASLMDRQMFALRDNDGKEPEDWIKDINSYLVEGRRVMYIGKPEDGHTLEPQIFNVNDSKVMARILSKDEESVEEWMSKNKTEAALRIAESEEKLNPPKYIEEVLCILDPES